MPNSRTSNVNRQRHSLPVCKGKALVKKLKVFGVHGRPEKDLRSRFASQIMWGPEKSGPIPVGRLATKQGGKLW